MSSKKSTKIKLVIKIFHTAMSKDLGRVIMQQFAIGAMRCPLQYWLKNLNNWCLELLVDEKSIINCV